MLLPDTHVDILTMLAIRLELDSVIFGIQTREQREEARMRGVRDSLVGQKCMYDAHAAVEDCSSIVEMSAINNGGLLRQNVMWRVRSHEAKSYVSLHFDDSNNKKQRKYPQCSSWFE